MKPNKTLQLIVCLVPGVVALACGGGESDVAPSEPPAPPVPLVEALELETEGEVDAVARAELVEIVRDPDPFKRARLLAERLPGWGADLTPTVRAILEDPILDVGASSFDLMVRFWAMHHPAAAAKWSVEEAPTIYRDGAVLTTVSEWARVDPEAVIAALEPWLASHTDLKDILPTALVRGWYAAGDPPELRAFIEGLGMGLLRQRALSTYIRARIQAEGIDPVLLWAEDVPEDDEVYKTAVYRQVASAVPLFDQAAGLDWCERHCEGPYGKGLRSIIARRWVWSDGRSAMEWVATGPEGHDRDLNIRLTFATWSRRDQPAAMDWAAEMTADGTPPEWMSPIWPVYTRMLAGDSPEDAIRWASEISSDEEREIVLTDIARTWLQLDPAAAEAWLETSPLSEQARAKAHRGKKRPRI